MKRRLEQLINGRYEYEAPRLILSLPQIQLELDPGRNYRGELSIGAGDGRKIKGYAAADHQRIILAKDHFSGTVSILEYGIDVTGLLPGDTVAGGIILLTSIGECTVPVEVKIREASIQSSAGRVGTLEDFTRLASRDFREAFGVFTGSSFRDVLGGNNRQFLSLYHGLARTPVTYQHLEEFLVAAGKKEPVRLSLDRSGPAVYRVEESMKDTLYLYKSTWGYVRAEVEAEGDFLEVEKKVVTTEDFIGSVYGLEFILHREKLPRGRHYGRITIRNIHQTLTYEIEARVGEDHPVPDLAARRLRARFLRDSLALQLHQLDYRAWYEKGRSAVAELRKRRPDDVRALFYEAWLCDAADDPEALRAVLWEMKRQQLPLPDAESQGLYLFFSRQAGILPKEEAEILPRLAALADREPASYILCRLVLTMDESYRSSPTRQIYALEQLYERGCRSPFLYSAALQILLEQEGQLRRLSSFLIRVLSFGKRYGLLRPELVRRTAYLGAHLKQFDRGVYEVLASGYEAAPSDDVLEAICRLIMQDRAARPEYFRWYALAVDHGVRLTRLYEFYIESMSQPVTGMLPQVIRMYFSYSNTLSSRKKAFIYANVIRNQKDDPTTYQSYKKAMEQFAKEQILLGRIDEDFAAVYREFIKKPTDDVTAGALARVLFTRKITCQDRRIHRVIVCHNALIKEASYPLIHGAAYVNIYSPDAQILLEDEKRRRFAVTVPYTSEALLEDREIARMCGEFDTKNPGLLLYLCRERGWQMELSSQNLSWYQQAVEQEDFTESYRKKVAEKLLEYYEAHIREDAVERAVYTWKDEAYAQVNKGSTVHLLVEHGLYERAYALTERSGYERVAAADLFRLASHMVIHQEFQEEEELLCLVSWVFRQGLYDEILLRYLRDYFVGTVEQMCGLWDKVRGFQLESDKLEERILTFAMFVRKYPKEGGSILENYIMHAGRERVILAYFHFLSIGWFLDGVPMSDPLFSYLERICQRGWELDVICRLALLKHYAEQGSPTPEQQELIAAFLKEFARLGLRFSFYQKLPFPLIQNYQIEDRFFVEERYPADSRVVIHYRIGEDSRWKAEPMKNMYQGIFVKEFLLFYGEKLEYYLTVENKNGREETPRRTHRMTDSLENGRSRYQLLNRILAARSIGNEEKLRQALQEYVERDTLVKDAFPLMK